MLLTVTVDLTCFFEITILKIAAAAFQSFTGDLLVSHREWEMGFQQTTKRVTFEHIYC